MKKFYRYSVLVTATMLTGCGIFGDYVPGDGPGAPLKSDDIVDATPRIEPLSKYGNMPSYVVDGREYFVMESANNYNETGVASWYGSKFHGSRTSSGETYDMYRMTAAHRGLPLPTYVEVTNLDNGKRTVVRVNDRGPFYDDRLIDLSYAAAVKLGVVESGTARVKVRALSRSELSAGQSLSEPTAVAAASGDLTNEATGLIMADDPPGGAVVAVGADLDAPLVGAATTLDAGDVMPVEESEGIQPIQPLEDTVSDLAPSELAATAPAESASTSAPATAAASSNTPPAGRYLQVGAFANFDNAARMQARINSSVATSAWIRDAQVNGQTVYRVQVGPVSNTEEPSIADQLKQIGISQYRVTRN